jgi:hypothetical protein
MGRRCGSSGQVVECLLCHLQSLEFKPQFHKKKKKKTLEEVETQLAEIRDPGKKKAFVQQSLRKPQALKTQDQQKGKQSGS